MTPSTDKKLPRAAAPAGWPTVMPRIFVADPQALVTFLIRVFGAAGSYDDERPSIMRLGDSVLMVSSAEARRLMTACLYVYVHDVDAAYRTALAEGARSIEAPMDMHYGDRRCMVEDPWGNTWQIAMQGKIGAAV